MAKYIMMGKYSIDAVKGAKAARTKKALGMIKKAGGRVTAMYALLGKYDIMLVTDFPGTKNVMKAAVDMTKLTGISFVSNPAITIAEFDKMIG